MSQAQALRSYHDSDGSRHEVLVCRTREGDWQVLDTSSRGTRVVETLSAITDGQPQAEAIARDYAATAAQLIPAKRHSRVERIPTKRGANGHSDNHPPHAPCPQRAGGTSLPHPAR